MKPLRAFLTAFIMTASAFAGADYSISLDTTPLIGHVAGPFSLMFEFADGSGTGDGNNAVILSNFEFGAGGSATGAPLLFGSAAGDLSSGVMLTDATPNSIFVQSFAPGDLLSFDLFLSTNLDAGIPDELIFSILDNTFTPIPSTYGGPLNPFLVIDINSDNPAAQVFAGDPNQTPAAGGGPILLAAPQVSSIVPEPSSLALASLSAVGFLAQMFFRKRRRARGRVINEASNR